MARRNGLFAGSDRPGTPPDHGSPARRPCHSHGSAAGNPHRPAPRVEQRKHFPFPVSQPAVAGELAVAELLIAGWVGVGGCAALIHPTWEWAVVLADALRLSTLRGNGRWCWRMRCAYPPYVGMGGGVGGCVALIHPT